MRFIQSTIAILLLVLLASLPAIAKPDYVKPAIVSAFIAGDPVQERTLIADTASEFSINTTVDRRISTNGKSFGGICGDRQPVFKVGWCLV